MWKLNRIIAQNLCAFKELDYTLSQGVTTLIFGDNRDNESQRSNGSGKSALLECIAIGITGSPLRKIKNEEIINDSAEECYVSLEFSNSSSSEVFTIERRLYRKGGSGVRCVIERDGKTVTTDETVQHSVDGYNKYILEKLGITRDELFNNFILSKHRYEDFLSSSDKEKKEIINRFSNGIVVDEAITKITEDITPVEKELHEVDLELAGVDGRIKMLTEQIEQEENSTQERANSKMEKIAAIEKTIADKRELLRGMSVQIDAACDVLVTLDGADKEIQMLENSEESLEICLNGIEMVLKPFRKLTDWNSVLKTKTNELAQVQQEQTALSDEITVLESEVKKQTHACDEVKSQHAKFVADATIKSEAYKRKLSDLEKEMQQANCLCNSLLEKRRAHSSAIELLKNKIAGVITCPRCEFEFVASDKSFDVTHGKEELELLQAELDQATQKRTETEKTILSLEQGQKEVQQVRRKLNTDNSEWLTKVDSAEKELQTLTFKLESMQRKSRQLSDRLVTIQSDIENTRRKMFDEAYEVVDSETIIRKREVKRLEEDIVATESSIETLYTTIGEINNTSSDEMINALKTSLKTYRKQSENVLKEKVDIEKQLSRLCEQQQRFGQFKSYLANTKIEALSKITNEFLESIGSDIRINFSGYTTLKTGKVREKISVSLVRDGMDCGSFGKFSEGEKARVNLSSILAMQKLVNSNCDDDKGLDLLVLDEILAAVDEEGNAKMFESLNKLGITALVVSHGHVSESYAHTLTIRKENGESRIV
jgi:exonuclease SbcC